MSWASGKVSGDEKGGASSQARLDPEMVNGNPPRMGRCPNGLPVSCTKFMATNIENGEAEEGYSHNVRCVCVVDVSVTSSSEFI